jgi:hypothetical protein
MARPSVIPKIIEVLEQYLERAELAWLAQPEGAREPTLPLTNDRKVNVAKLVELTGLPPSYAQHFFKPEIANVVNAVANAQRVKRIGSRALADAEDDASRQTINKLRAETKRQSEAHSQSRVRNAELERKVVELEDKVARLEMRLEHLQESGSLLRTSEIIE